MTRKIFEITMSHIFVNNMSQVDDHVILWIFIKITSFRIKPILHPFRNRSGLSYHLKFLKCPFRSTCGAKNFWGGKKLLKVLNFSFSLPTSSTSTIFSMYITVIQPLVFYPVPLSKVFYPIINIFTNRWTIFQKFQISFILSKIMTRSILIDNFPKIFPPKRTSQSYMTLFLIIISKTFEISNIYGFLLWIVNISKRLPLNTYQSLSKNCWDNFDFKIFYQSSNRPLHTIFPSQNTQYLDLQ